MEGQVISWGMPIIIYLYLGGLAGGAYIISALADLCDIDEDKLIEKIGFTVALVGILIGTLCLLYDLGRPDRFLNIIKVYKFTSPMSVGVWGVITFTIFSLLSVLMIFGIDKKSKGIWKLGYYMSLVVPRKAVNAIGLSVGVFLAAYTGVLLTETSRPFWSDTPFLGALFLASGVSTAIAFIYFFYGMKRHDEIAQINKYKLKLVDNMAIVAEIVILIFMMLQLNNIGHLVYLNKFKTLWIVGVILAGMVLPIILNFISIISFRVKGMKLATDYITPLLILIGGFLLRYVIVMAGQA